MSKPPSPTKQSQRYILDLVEAQALHALTTQQTKQQSQTAAKAQHQELAHNLQTQKYRLDALRQGQKCPVPRHRPKSILTYTNAFAKRAQLFDTRAPRPSEIQRLRTALSPFAKIKLTSPSAPAHICLEVTMQKDGSYNISAWNPQQQTQLKK